MAKKMWLVFALMFIFSSSTVLACLTVSDSTRDISSSSTLCPNAYSLSNGLNIIANNILLDCNGALIKGLNTGSGVLIQGRSNVTILNCTFVNFENGVLVQESSDVSVISGSMVHNGVGLSVITSKDVFAKNILLNDSIKYDIFNYSNLNFNVQNLRRIDNLSPVIISEYACVGSCEAGCAFINNCLKNSTKYEKPVEVKPTVQSAQTIMFSNSIDDAELKIALQQSGVSKMEFTYCNATAQISHLATSYPSGSTVFTTEVKAVKDISSVYIYIFLPAEFSKSQVTFSDGLKDKTARSGRLLRVYVGSMQAGQTRIVKYTVDGISKSKPFAFTGSIEPTAKLISSWAILIMTLIYIVYLAYLLKPVEEKEINRYYTNKLYKFMAVQKRALQNLLHALPAIVVLYYLMGTNIQILLGPAIPAVLLCLAALCSFVILVFILFDFNTV